MATFTPREGLTHGQHIASDGNRNPSFFQPSPFSTLPRLQTQQNNMGYLEEPSHGRHFADPQATSFFEESLVLGNEQGMHSFGQLRHIPRGAFRPLDYKDYAQPIAMPEAINTHVPAPRILNHHVDAGAYSQVDYSELATASVGYSATSPASVDNISNGPLTPTCEGSFVEKFFDRNPKRTTSVAQNFVTKIKEEHETIQLHQISPLYYTHASQDMANPGRQIWSVTGLQMCSGTDTLAIPGMGNRSLHFGHLTYHLPVAPSTSVNPQAICPGSPQESVHSANSVTPELSEVDDGRSTSSPLSEQSPTADTPRSNENQSAERRIQDRLLVEWRQERKSYKEIKELLNCKEAESTLRGRYRTLTKPKSERLRNPKWTTRDDRLLIRAVEYYEGNDDIKRSKSGSNKIPWELVSQWVKDHGGTYRFAAAASSKRYAELSRSKRTR